MAGKRKGPTSGRKRKGRAPASGAPAASRSTGDERGHGHAPCPLFGRCGGCQLLDVPYAEQLARKEAEVRALLGSLAPEGAFRPIAGMDDPFRYRNKVATPFAPDRRQHRGKADVRSRRDAILTGMYAAGTHQLIPAQTCLIENERAKAATLAVRDLMAERSIAPYDEDAGTGFMRHAVARAAQATGELIVTLVTNAREFPSSRSFCRELARRVPGLTTVVQNVNLGRTNAILGREERTLYGPGFILDRLCGLSFRISSQSFYQVNAAQAEVLYDAAVGLAGLDGGPCVIDAYCGTGTIGLVAAARGAAQVVGVDAVASAIADARQNAARNGIGNARFAAEDAAAFMARAAAEGRAAAGLGEGRPLVVLMDPPRAGATEQFLDAARALAPERIVYVSCNPETQARDCARLASNGYRLVVVQPVDMFPHTRHVECVALLQRA